MRATILAATLACAALCGCDQTPTATVAPAAPVAPAPVAAPPAAPTPSVAQYPTTHRHHRHAWAREESSQSEYSESEVSTYGYVSDSRSSSGEQSEVADARAGGGLWVDGFGRGYFTSGHARRAGTMHGKRLAPWKGYDAGCDR